MGTESRTTVTWGVVLAVSLVLDVPETASAKPGSAPSPARVRQAYRVEKGDTLPAIAAALDIAPEDLRKWNGLKSDMVRPGKVLRYFGPRLQPESIGSPGSGRLQLGVRIPYDGPGYLIDKDRQKVWGTPETVKYVRLCMAQYRAQFPLKAKGPRKGPPVSVGDLSPRNGGRAPPHVSHESGRDVDVGFITIPPQSPGVFDREATTANLDRPKQWAVVKCFLDNKDTKWIMMQWPVVHALKEFIEKVSKKNRALKRYLGCFQGGSGVRIIGDSDHRTHMHVRFRCPKGDKRCIE